MIGTRRLVACVLAVSLLSAGVAGTVTPALAQVVDDSFEIAYGETVSDGVPDEGAGNIEVGGATDSYGFDSVAGDIAIFDVLSGAAATFRWRLQSPSGATVFDGLYVDRSIELTETGRYVLTVYGATETTVGTYSFRLLLTPPPQDFAIAFGETVSDGVPAPGAGNVEVPGALDRYHFDAIAGQAAIFDALTGTTNQVRWSLTAPDGTSLFDSLYVDQQVTLPEDGVYTLTVSGLGITSTGTYSFRLLEVPEPQEFSIAFGDTVSDGVPQPGAGNLEGPGAVDRYLFAGTAGQVAILDALTGSTIQVRWSLTAPDGTPMFDTFYVDQQVTLLQTGTYVLEVDGQSITSFGTYSFQLIDVPPQVDEFNIAFGDTISDGVPASGAGNLEGPGAIDRYLFDATTGQVAILDALTGDIDHLRWSLTEPDGTLLFDSLYVDQEITLPQGGVYTLTVSGLTITSFGTYSFQLREPPPNNPPVAVDDMADTDPGVEVTIDVLANDSDPDGDILSIDAVAQPGNGGTAIDGDRIVYTPDSGFSGIDTFTYTVSDGRGGTAEAFVAVTVHEPPEVDAQLEVETTAETSFTRNFEWGIDKSVTPDTWDLFTGDSGTSEYTVEVTRTVTDSDWAVRGTITIHNPHPSQAATITDVSDVVSPSITATVDCGATVPHVLVAGGTLVCTYSATLPDGANRVNSATVTTTGLVGGGTATADVIFGDPTTVVGPEAITVDDSFAGALGTFGDSGMALYERTFTCDEDEGRHDDTATINETGQAASASATVNCHDLTAEKTASTSLIRTWEWTIEKSAEQADLLLAEGQLFELSYQVMLDAIATDSDHTVSGEISISNPAPVDAHLAGVSDVVSPGIAASVNCPSLVVPAGGSLVCAYTVALPDDSTRTNTATATVQNFDYDRVGTATLSGTTDFSSSARVDFSNATMNEIDECVEVSDTEVGHLGAVCADRAPQTLGYSLLFGAHPDADMLLVCGENTHRNVASFSTNDTGTSGEDDQLVEVLVACGEGCTLASGYWKTHTDRGPATFDDTWNLLPNGSDTVFFSSGQTYYQVLWTPAAGGNAYYMLAHAYIAAELNRLNGASVPADVLAAFDQATAMFDAYTPSHIGTLVGNKAPRPTFLVLAEILDDYNDGITGPGHCSEDANSA